MPDSWHNFVCNDIHIRGYSSSVERQLPKLNRRVRLPLSAPFSKEGCLIRDSLFISFPKSTLPDNKSTGRSAFES